MLTQILVYGDLLVSDAKEVPFDHNNQKKEI
jgi:hypothetical protein